MANITNINSTVSLNNNKLVVNGQFVCHVKSDDNIVVVNGKVTINGNPVFPGDNETLPSTVNITIQCESMGSLTIEQCEEVGVTCESIPSVVVGGSLSLECQTIGVVKVGGSATINGAVCRKVYARGSAAISDDVEGGVISRGSLTIGGNVVGDVEGKMITIKGKVAGDVKGKIVKTG